MKIDSVGNTNLGHAHNRYQPNERQNFNKHIKIIDWIFFFVENKKKD